MQQYTLYYRYRFGKKIATIRFVNFNFDSDESALSHVETLPDNPKDLADVGFEKGDSVKLIVLYSGERMVKKWLNYRLKLRHL